MSGMIWRHLALFHGDNEERQWNRRKDNAKQTTAICGKFLGDPWRNSPIREASSWSPICNATSRMRRSEGSFLEWQVRTRSALVREQVISTAWTERRASS